MGRVIGGGRRQMGNGADRRDAGAATRREGQRAQGRVIGGGHDRDERRAGGDVRVSPRVCVRRAQVGNIENVPRGESAACGGQVGHRWRHAMPGCESWRRAHACTGVCGCRRGPPRSRTQGRGGYERGSERGCRGGDEWGRSVGSGGGPEGAANKGREGERIAGEVIRPGSEP